MNKRLYSIPACLPFADTLAEWVLACYGSDPVALPRILMLLPSRRACLALREAFLCATGGKPTLLPRMQPLGDVENDMFLTLPWGGQEGAEAPLPSFSHKRLFVLAQLVRAYQSTVHGKTERMDHAILQAQSIATLLDQVEREGAHLGDLASLVPEEFSQHWQLTTEFLAIIAEYWPAIAAEHGLISPEVWRNRQLQALTASWQKHPPEHPVIAAGSTGSIASTSALLGVIASLPQGAVVLPGLDKTLMDEDTALLAESHPQYGMHELLGVLKVEPAEVEEIGVVDVSGAARLGLLSLALCPAQQLQRWRVPLPHLQDAVQGLSFMACAHEQEEATAIALMLRETLETPEKTAALITHDRALARRVAAEMQRYGVQVDDSAGRALADTPAVAFLRLVLAVAEENAAPVALLAMLKHPYAHVGMERMECLEATRALERAVLRGVCPTDGLAGLRAELLARTNPPTLALSLLDGVEHSLNALLSIFQSNGGEEFSYLLETHLKAAEALAGEVLWQGREAKILAEHIAELRDAAPDAGMMEVAAYPAVFDALLVGKVVRPDYGTHPRLKILSPLEARMQSFDRVILGGLNEGIWPPQVVGDPWLNRSMRACVGLASEQRQIGLSAHDFATLAAAPQVILTRAEKVGGSPTTPARWWVRLSTLLGHYGVVAGALPYAHWAGQLYTATEVVPCARPAPTPPLEARPRTVAVTQVEHWIADPYRFYAANILKLRKLNPIDEDPTAADFGTQVHRALQLFVDRYPSQLPDDALDELLRIGRDVFAPHAARFPVVEAWWWPRFEQVAAWMLEQEKTLRPLLGRVWAEVQGSVEVEGITFTARADRIETLREGGLAIVDYKTGGTHNATQTKMGNAPQLVLLALLAEEGKWDVDIAAQQVKRLEYWIAGGGRNSGEIREVDGKHIHDYAHLARERLVALIREFQNPATPYSCHATGQERYNDFAHLARMREWY